MNQQPYVFHKFYDWAIDNDGDLVPIDDPKAYTPTEKYVYKKPDEKISNRVKILNPLKNIIRSLKEIASEEYQDKGWVRGEIHEYCTFTETIARFLNEGMLETFIREEAQQYGLSEKQIKELDQLRREIEAYIDQHIYYEDPCIILHDSEWHKIRENAKSVLKSLGIENYLDPSKAVLKQALLYRIYKLARPDFQEKVWVIERNPQFNPFDELMRDFFETCHSAEIIRNFEEYEISKKQQEVLVQLYQALKNYCEQLDDPEDIKNIVKDPKWQQIQKLSQEVLEVFNFDPWVL